MKVLRGQTLLGHQDSGFLGLRKLQDGPFRLTGTIHCKSNKVPSCVDTWIIRLGIDTDFCFDLDFEYFFLFNGLRKMNVEEGR